MSYVKTEWATGDVITAQKLNNMEDGIEAVDEYADIFTADVSESVENWLDDHPEATTTVEDGAITTPKLADGAVTTPKLANGSVTDDKLASDGIKAEVSDLKSDFTKIVSNAVDFKEINGNSLTWENKIVTNNGAISESAYVILSNYISVEDITNPCASFLGSKTADNAPCYSYVVQYTTNADTAYIKRDLLLHANGTTYDIELEPSCKYVRFLYGHENATGKTMSTSNGVYFKSLIAMNTIDHINDIESRLFGNYSIDFANENLYSVLIATSTNKWRTGNNRSSYIVEIPKNTLKIEVTANNNIYAEVALLKTSNHIDNTDPDYATGETQKRTIPKGETIEFAIPLDCRYLFVLNTYETDNYLPSVVKVNSPNSVESSEALPIGLHTMPKSSGVLNVIKRCRQLTDIKWTPVIDLPRLNSVSGNYEAEPLVVYEGVFKAGKEYTGIPYGRTDGNINGYTYAFVGMEIGFDTFISSVRNAESSLCKTSQYSASNHKSVKYAVVCSALSSYAFGWAYTPTQNIPSHTGVSKVADIISNGTRMDLSLIRLGDIICLPSWHVGIVTDIVADNNGDVTVIEVSEADTCGNGNQDINGGLDGGICRRKGWTVEDFFETWGTFSVYRYSGIDSVIYTPSKYVNVGDEPNMMRYEEFPCMPYMGEGYKYKSGYTSNTDILISCNAYDYLRVFKDGTEIANSPFALTESTEKVSVGFSEIGNYIAYLCNMSEGVDTIKTHKCHWSVIE